MITLLAFLLLNPLIKSVFREVEKPIVVIAADNSQSILTGSDSIYYKTEFLKSLDQLADNLSADFDVRKLTVGEKINTIDKFTSLQFTERQSDLASFFDEAFTRFTNRNAGALILASDGLYNRGENPVYAANNIKVPVFTLALGDTGIRRDLKINNVSYNKTAFLGNSFPVSIQLDARKCAGEKTKIEIIEDSLVLFNKTVEIPSQSYRVIIPAMLDARKQGIHHYRIITSPVTEEVNTINNSTNIVVEVLSKKQEILILANAPHPDIAALKQTLESSETYSVQVVFADKPEANFRNASLVIFHQIPSGTLNTTQLVKKILDSETPFLFVCGSQTSINEFNSIQNLVTISQTINKTSEVLPQLNDNFSLFTLSDETKARIRRFGPLTAPFGSYKLKGESQKLFNQKIGQVSTDNALCLFSVKGESRGGIIAGEGIWKWKMQEFADYNNTTAFDELMQKIVQYISSKEKRELFHINHKHVYAENEPLLMDAELYNESNELVNTPDLLLNIVNESGKKFPYAFSKIGKTYSLNAGFLPPGKYSFNGKVTLGSKSFVAEGKFRITDVQAEFSETVADMELMQLIAGKHEGKMLPARDAGQVVQLLKAKEEVKPVVYTQNKFSEMINLKWVFFLLLLLISTEWFLRKRSGGY